MRTKETGFTLPAVILLLDYAFFKAEGFVKRPLGLVPYLLAAATIPLSFLSPGEAGGFGASVAEGMMRLQKIEMAGLSRYGYFITELRVMVRYLRLIVFPADQNIYYDYPFFTSILAPEVFLSLLFILALIGSSVYLLVRSARRGSPWGLLASTGVLWFFIALSVESSFIPIYDAIYEHRLYLPSAGIFISFGALLFYSFERVSGISGSRLSYGAASALFIIVFSLPLGTAAYKRNKVWKDAVSLWEDSVRKSPQSSLSHQNLGSSYYRLGWIERAEREFREAVSLKPGFFLPHYNLGVLLQESGRLDEAVRELKEALRLEPRHLQSRYNLGLSYMAMGLHEGAALEFVKILEISPSFFEVRFSLAGAYEAMGRFDKAVENYAVFIERAPEEYSPYKEKARLRVAALKPRNP